MCIHMPISAVSELETFFSVMQSPILILNFFFLVKEKATWLFLSRNQSLRKRYTEHFLEAAQCLQNGVIHHNITGKTRLGSFLSSQV